MIDLITEARELATENISQPTVFYKDKSQRIMFRLCDALRECAEREKGCEFCKGITPILKDYDCADVVRIELAKNGSGSRYLLDERDEKMQWAIKISFCPMCGRKLERSEG